MGRTYSTQGGKEACIQGFGGKARRKDGVAWSGLIWLRIGIGSEVF
jgi:hypothetical protein